MVLFQWGVSSFFGWGVYGLNLLLSWALRGGPEAACVKGFDRAHIDVDPLEARAIEPALRRSEHHAAQLGLRAGQEVWTRHLVLHDINNGMVPGKAAYDVVVRSERQVGVAFLDRAVVEPGAAEGLGRYAFVVAGSSWNASLLRQVGAARVETLLQGVDTSHFHLAPRRGLFPGRFVVFSGGKLEYRKGQDLVLQAFAIFARRRRDALLLTSWANHWPALSATVGRNEALAPPPLHADGAADILGWAEANGIAPEQVMALEPVPNRAMARIMREADVGLFPNRAEGGTNLVAMECMACGVPVILSANTGHLDLVGAGRCIPLVRQTPIAGEGHEGWQASSVDEILAALEWVYEHRTEAEAIGRGGAAFIAPLTWRAQMDTLAGLLAPLNP